LYFSFFKNSKFQIKTTGNIRVLQLIDSLEIGGAEKMAVQLANALSSRVAVSALCCTRKAGPLKTQIKNKVEYLELKKKHALDITALLRLKKFVKEHQITILHAHGSSFFIAWLFKIISPKIKLVWHDHNGERDLTNVSNSVLKIVSSSFNHVLCVNTKLELWSKKHLYCPDITQVNNFITIKSSPSHSNLNILLGNRRSVKIIHVANLRVPKDHLTGIKAIELLVKDNFEVTYHLVGNYDKNDTYYKTILQYIQQNKLSNHVFIYGPKHNVKDYLEASDVGILTSTHEGLPLSLIEYALAKLVIITTDVGECKNFVEDYAKVFEPKDFKVLYSHLKETISNTEIARLNSEKLYKKAIDLHSENAVVIKLMKVYEEL